MFEKLLLYAAAEALDGAGKVVKNVGEKVSNIQKDSFEKFVEQDKGKEKRGEQIWLEESNVVKKALLSEKECRGYCVYNMNDQLIYQASTGNIEKRVSMDIKDEYGNTIARIREIGEFLDKLNAKYSIYVDGDVTYTASIDYNCLKPCIELKEKGWKVSYEIGGLKNITDNNGGVLTEVKKKIGKRRLVNIYSDEKSLCIILILLGIVNGVRFVHYQ